MWERCEVSLELLENEEKPKKEINWKSSKRRNGVVMKGEESGVGGMHEDGEVGVKNRRVVVGETSIFVREGKITIKEEEILK